MECVRRARAMGSSIRQWIDDLELFDDRAWPSVRDDEWQCFFMFRANVNEMNVQPVDLGDELREGVQFCLALSPVVSGRPIAGKFPHCRKLHALRLICDSLLFGPLRGRNAPAKLIELGLRYADGEGADRGIFRRLARSGCRGDNDCVGIGACYGLSVARRGEHKGTDGKRGRRTSKKVAPSERRGQGRLEGSTSRKDKPIGSRRGL